MVLDLVFNPRTYTGAHCKKGSYIMAIKKVTSNIVNLGFTITSEDGKAGVAIAGVEVTQAIVNGVSAGVGLRTLNGARKSAQISLDAAALSDLRDALTEVLEGME